MVTRRMDTKKGRDTTIDQWMKTHSVQDMEAIVNELASEGEDVKEMAEVVHELEEMAEEEHEWERTHLAKGKSEVQTS